VKNARGLLLGKTLEVTGAKVLKNFAGNVVGNDLVDRSPGGLRLAVQVLLVRQAGLASDDARQDGGFLLLLVRVSVVALHTSYYMCFSVQIN